MDQAESNTVDEVLAQLKYQVIPTLADIKKTAEKQEKHLEKLNGTVGMCLQQDAVLASRLETVEDRTDDTAKKQTKSDDKFTKTIIVLGSLIIAALLAALFDLLSKIV